MAANIWARKSEEGDDNKRLASYLEDLDGDISNLDVKGAAARTALKCYDRQFALLLKEIKAKKITRDMAQQQYDEIAWGRKGAISLLDKAIKNGNDLEKQYQEAFANEEAVMASPERADVPQAQKKKNAALLKTAKRRSRELNKKNRLSCQRKGRCRQAHRAPA